ncbi:hypothetical protein DFJ73DRAFT_847444 [Zopfochytrium polystomum]|nr:hypothetical protein DFJ73DRAFT_847444 [Zopfochytrium polystomum]
MYVTRFEAAKRRWSGADGGNGATTTTTTTAAAKAGSRASSTERKSVQSMKEEELEDAVGARIRLEKENARLKLLVEALDLRVTHLERRTQSLEQKLLAFQTERETRRNESLSRVGDVNGDLKFHDASIIQTSSFLDGSAIDHELHLALLQQPPPTAVGSPPPRRWSLEKPPPKNDASPPSAATATARAYVPAGEFFETQASVNVMRRSSSGLGKPSTAAAAAAAPAPRDEGEKRGSQFRWTVGAEGVYATSVVGGEQRDGRVGGGPSGGELSETIRSLEERMRATAELLRSRARRIKGGGGIGGDLSVR